MDTKRATYQALADSVLTGGGRAPADRRALAFAGDGPEPPPLATLVRKVVTAPARVTEEDLAAALATGCTEDELFELVVCAAVGHSARLYDAGLAALAEATAEGRHDDAS